VAVGVTVGVAVGVVVGVVVGVAVGVVVGVTAGVVAKSEYNAALGLAAVNVGAAAVWVYCIGEKYVTPPEPGRRAVIPPVPAAGF
jgi:hypothetical protein